MRPQAFGTALFPGLDAQPGIALLEQRYAASIRREVAQKLDAAQAGKRTVSRNTRRPVSPAHSSTPPPATRHPAHRPTPHPRLRARPAHAAG
jgi:hypothetical protein